MRYTMFVLGGTFKVSPSLHSARALRVRQRLTARMQSRAFCLAAAMENWKDIPGYEGRYQVSDQGCVRSLITDRVLSPNRMNHGYMCVHLYRGGKATRKVRTIHQLVAISFLANPDKHREVNHKNFDRADNRTDNLEWIDRRGNVLHAIANGRRFYPEKKIRGLRLHDDYRVTFSSQLAAEIWVAGKQTGGISHGMKNNRPAYGFVWWWV